MALSRVRHIFFDLDHTLWDFETNSTNALRQLFSARSLAEKGAHSIDLFLERYAAINEECWTLYRNGKMTKEVLRTIRFERTLDSFGIGDSGLASKLADEYLEISPYQTALMPGSVEILEYLRADYRLHILTNGFDEVQHTKLDNSGLRPFFDEIITSEEVDARKPSPVIFGHSLDRTGAKPQESLMIGDNLEADVLGARDAEWKQVFYNPHKMAHNETLEFEIHHLLELKEML